jgi:hypothetical protein
MNGVGWNPPFCFNPLRSVSGVSPSPHEWLGTCLLHLRWLGCIPTCQIHALRVVKQHGTAPNWQQNHITPAVWRSLSTTGLVGQCSWYSPGLPEPLPHRFGALGRSLYPSDGAFWATILSKLPSPATGMVSVGSHQPASTHSILFLVYLPVPRID